ncbi:ubiquitin carboxyl-terminal hydrolase 45-like [Sitophilus oryzae]|uniref:Ubiquitin carboxyl-terminal hydrolase 45-like n=1 Tax=Sitophilus oryzae TaxID=7048 RepID=A0A6J2XHQ5_SITOR|nr:ubiquitin carboxyl-terminal hydrolase 45-like [Sitophilus oryzae]
MPSGLPSTMFVCRKFGLYYMFLELWLSVCPDVFLYLLKFFKAGMFGPKISVPDSCNNVIIPLPPPGGEDLLSKAPESGYNSDKIENSSPDSNNHRTNSPSRLNPNDSGVPSPTAPGKICAQSASPNSPENSPASSETNVDMGSPILGNNSPDEEYGECNSSFQRPMSRLAFVETHKSIDLKADLEKLSLLNDGDSTKVNSCDNTCGQNAKGAYASEPTEMMDEDDDSEDYREYSGTLAPRYQCEEGECSVESCLNQFTECELMMGRNQVSCDNCTKCSDKVPKETVYRDASKQLLIYNPPAVLILHLKRFQVYRFRSMKVNKFVKFSTMLDLGPYCSKRAQNLPSFEPDQTKVLYSLYGVVEPGIRSGRYVSHVQEFRGPRIGEGNSMELRPQNQRKNLKKALDNSAVRGDETVEPPAGKWYYISDSFVNESRSYLLSVLRRAGVGVRDCVMPYFRLFFFIYSLK